MPIKIKKPSWKPIFLTSGNICSFMDARINMVCHDTDFLKNPKEMCSIGRHKNFLRLAMICRSMGQMDKDMAANCDEVQYIDSNQFQVRQT